MVGMQPNNVGKYHSTELKNTLTESGSCRASKRGGTLACGTSCYVDAQTLPNRRVGRTPSTSMDTLHALLFSASTRRVELPLSD